MNEAITRPSPDLRSSLPISILACGGSLPLEIATSLERTGKRPQIVCIAGMADADFSGFKVATVSIGRVGALLRALRAGGAREMVIAGHARRPDLRSLKIDAGFVRHLVTILSLMRGGDDHVLRRIAGFFSRAGLTVRSIADVAPELLTPYGDLTRTPTPDASHSPPPPMGEPPEASAALGWQVIRDLGRFDVGQAVIVEDDRVIAIEGAEGTDGLLTRLPPVAGKSRTLVKAAKPDQDLRVDLPTIGPGTIEQCAASAVRTIAIEAGRSLIVARTETIAKAREHAISLTGFAPAPSQPLAGGGGARGPAAFDHRAPPTNLASLARTEPRAGARRDVIKGVELLSEQRPSLAIRAALVVRENILALNIGEPLADFIERSAKLHQWGDRRQHARANRTLVLAKPSDGIDDTLLHHLSASKIAGLAFMARPEDIATLDVLIAGANARNLFLLSVQ